MVFDEFLFSFSGKNGAAIWDIATGERLHIDTTFYPSRYHHGVKRWLSQPNQETFIVSALGQTS
jgi:hypothetical protein